MASLLHLSSKIAGDAVGIGGGGTMVSEAPQRRGITDKSNREAIFQHVDYGPIFQQVLISAPGVYIKAMWHWKAHSPVVWDPGVPNPGVYVGQLR